MEVISSTNNPLYKQLVRLEKKRERDKTGHFTIEGIREIQMALGTGIQIQQIILNQKWKSGELESFTENLKEVRTTQFSDDLFAKISYRSNVSNALAIAETPKMELDNLSFGDCPLILVLETVEKPGNLGAIYRTADAAGVDAIILANPAVDVLNPNVIRASLGSIFSVPFAQGTNEEVLQLLQMNKIKVVATWLKATMPHYGANYTEPCAIVMGSEAHGITRFWQDESNAQVKIPMRGKVDSMNVSTATAVVVYEAIRQRENA